VTPCEQRFELSRIDTAGNPPEGWCTEPLSLLGGSPNEEARSGADQTWTKRRNDS